MKKILMIFAFLCAFILAGAAALSQPYRYPALPGSDLWKQQKSYLDRVKLCNIPDSILRNMSTEDLLITVFQFPYIQNLFLYDNFINGFDNLKSIFNGLDNLMDRRDAPQLLFKLYCQDSTNTLAQDILLEGMLSLPSVLTNIDSAQKNVLLDTCLNKLNNRIESENFLIGKSMVSSSFLMIRLLSHLDYNLYKSIIDYNEDIKKFSETSEYPDKSTINKIIYEIIKYKR